MHYDHLIIGGGVAGVTAAETIRAKDPSASIAVIGSEPHLLYSRVLLPHFVRGRIAEAKTYLKDEESFRTRRIDLLRGRTVVRVDAAGHRVLLDDGTERTWKKLLVATGGKPRRLECPGATDDTCMNFQYIEDARALAAVSAGPAVTVGGGFIAIEFLMSFAAHDIKNLAVIRGNSFFSKVLDPVSAARVHGALERHGVEVRTNASVRAIESDGVRKRIFLDSGERIDCATIGVGIGLEPNVAFLSGSGIAVRSGGVVVDDRLRASVADVFAAGDVAEYMDPLVGEHHIVGNWTNATLQGRRAGLNMAGEDAVYDQITSYSITCFDLPLAFVGATDVAAEETLVREYPDGAVLQMRLVGGRTIAATNVGPFIDRAAVNRLINDRIRLDEKQKKAFIEPKISLSSL